MTFNDLSHLEHSQKEYKSDIYSDKPTRIYFGNVSCVTNVMIYSYGVNTEFRNKSQMFPLPLHFNTVDK